MEKRRKRNKRIPILENYEETQPLQSSDYFFLFFFKWLLKQYFASRLRVLEMGYSFMFCETDLIDKNYNNSFRMTVLGLTVNLEQLVNHK